MQFHGLKATAQYQSANHYTSNSWHESSVPLECNLRELNLPNSRGLDKFRENYVAREAMGALCRIVAFANVCAVNFRDLKGIANGLVDADSVVSKLQS